MARSRIAKASLVLEGHHGDGDLRMTRNMLDVIVAEVARLSADLQKAKLSGEQSFRGTRGSEAGSTRRKLAVEHEVVLGD